MFEAIALAALAVVLFVHDLGEDGPESSDYDKETPPKGWEDRA